MQAAERKGMMIREITGVESGRLQYTRCTPKRRAALNLAAAIQGYTECMDLEAESPEMTPREVEQVRDQIIKLETRILKLLRVDED